MTFKQQLFLPLFYYLYLQFILEKYDINLLLPFPSDHFHCWVLLAFRLLVVVLYVQGFCFQL